MLHTPKPLQLLQQLQQPSTENRKNERRRSVRRSDDQSQRRPRGLLTRIDRSAADLVIMEFLQSLGTPRALTVWLLYKNKEHKQVVELTIDPACYLDRNLPNLLGYFHLGIQRFRCDYAATKFLSKCIGLKTGIDLKAVAIDSAVKAEVQCKRTNDRIREMRETGVVTPFLSSVWYRAQQIVSNILGPLPASFDDVGWSPGRSTSASGSELTSVHKYTSRLDVTPSSLGQALRLVQDSPNWGAAALNADGPVSVLTSAFTLVKGNTMITVPKNAKTDRVICYEPHMNIRIQKMVGDYVRRRLTRVGVDLRRQSVNQRRALLASKTRHLATIDLSMASDTLALELVFELLPVDWAVYLDSLRSKYTLWPDGVTRRNEKFSSMGNGFTFELESLIFYALCRAVTNDVSVYGDDIIVPTTSFDSVKTALEESGFVLNTAKSFSTGNFRESCGMDVFCGVDCTPVYLRNLPKMTEDVVKIHNQVRLWCGRDIAPSLHFSAMLRKWRNVHTHLYGPQGYGDGHYHVNLDEATPRRASDGLEGWWYKSSIRIFSDNTMYGDRVSGRFSDGFGFGALCAGTGPKRLMDIYSSTVDRRLWKYVAHRGLASFWQDVVWV